MYKLMIISAVLLVATQAGIIHANQISSNVSYIAERGRSMDMNNMNRDHSNDFNRDNANDFNKNDADHGAAYGAAYGADRGAAYGAAAGSAAGNNSGVPVNPNAAEQNMLYYGGVQNMEQGQ
jgi:hypothetical protein